MTMIQEPEYCKRTGRKVRGAIIKCHCGAKVELALHGADEDCPKCGQVWNCFGQRIDFPNGQGFDYAGEYNDPEDYLA